MRLKAGYTMVQRSNQIRFSEIGIKGMLSSALEKQFQIIHPTLSQKAFIPAILSGADLFIRDITGSGKTFGLALAAVAYPRLAHHGRKHLGSQTLASNNSTLHAGESDADEDAIHDQTIADESNAVNTQNNQNVDFFQLPIRNDQKMDLDRYVHTLIIVPTRDLAIQVFNWIKGISGSYVQERDIAYMVQCLISGPEVQSQKDLLSKFTPRIVVGTPNRLLEFFNSKDLDLSRIRLLIVDEADRIVNAESANDTVNKRFNMKVHKLDGESLIEQLFATRKLKVNETKIQVIACSASINSSLRNKFKRSGWVKDPIHVDTTGSLALPKTLEHHAFIVQADGLYAFDWTKPDDDNQEESLSVVKSDAKVDSKTQKGFSKNENDTTLADDDLLIIESVKYIIEQGNLESGFIFTHSSVSVRKLVSNLNAVGLDARRFVDIRNYQEQSQSQSLKLDSNLPRWLVLTEHEARGLDLPKASVVFILGPSSSPQSYLHMAGRVGRAGRNGKVISVLGGHNYEKRFKSMANILKISPSTNIIK